MSELTAIDILVNPDEATLARAREVNARMRESVPSGFALDSDHQPHITTLQRYVRTAELVHVFEAVEEVLARTDGDQLSYQAVSIRHTDWGVPGQGLAVLFLQPSPGVLSFQAGLLEAVTPFVGSDGTPHAFVTDDDEPTISQSTMDWVEGFVPAQIGADKYIAHVTVGFATFEDLKVIESDPFDAFPVRPISLSAYQLGNNGTARTELKRWTLRT
jgi:2'-5' RNA ligase